MNAFDVIGDPVRRRIIELLADGERTAGDITSTVTAEFGISQPAVSNQLRVLRESGFAAGERRGSHRMYVLQPGPMRELDEWVGRSARFWMPRLDALDTELARGRRAEREGDRP